MQPTWEPIIELDRPRPLDELLIHETRGIPFDLADQRDDLYQEVLDYWNTRQKDMAMVRAPEFADAFARKDEKLIAHLMGQIGRMEAKVRFTRGHLRAGGLYLALGTVNYAEYIGTHDQALRNSHFRTRLMNAGLNDRADPDHYFANTLSICAVVSGYDNPKSQSKPYVVVGQRSDKVMIYPNAHHVIGGTIERKNGKIRLAEKIRRELNEEIGLTDEEMGPTTLYGIVRQTPSRVPEIITNIPIYLSQHELEDRWHAYSADKFEHRKLSFYTPDALRGFLDEHGETMVPSGAAALTSFLRYQQK